MKKYFIIFFLFCFVYSAFSQKFHSKIKVNGLTCAMCSYSTHRSLEKLDFIKDIIPNLESTSFILEFKEGMFVDFDLIQEKIEDAGFFLGETEIIFENTLLKSNDTHSLIDNNLFHFFSEENKESKVFKLVDKNFIDKEKFDELSSKTNHSCYLTGRHSKSCCTNHENLKSNKLFHLKSDI